MIDTLLDNLSTLFHPTRKKELEFDRLIEADNITAIKKQITTRQAADQKIHYNKCPLIYWACCCNSYRVLLHLLAIGGDYNQPNSLMGWRPLDYCIENKKYSLMRLLLLVGADPDLQRLKAKVTALDMAEPITRQFIQSIEVKKQQLSYLKEQYGIQKDLADRAYKIADINMAQSHYLQAANTCKTIANIWNSFVNEEAQPNLREYYRAQASQYLKFSEVLNKYTGQKQQLEQDNLQNCFQYR
jgi:hypothetical protein